MTARHARGKPPSSDFLYVNNFQEPHEPRVIELPAGKIEAGEDPRFLARRIVIAAAEDVGNADPRALQLAVAAMQATEMIGLPEAQYALAQAAAYVASAPKSNRAGSAYFAALAMLSEPGKSPQIVRSGETSLEGLTRDLLRPMLAEWLDRNLPGMVEKLVRDAEAHSEEDKKRREKVEVRNQAAEWMGRDLQPHDTCASFIALWAISTQAGAGRGRGTVRPSDSK